MNAMKKLLLGSGLLMGLAVAVLWWHSGDATACIVVEADYATSGGFQPYAGMGVNVIGVVRDVHGTNRSRIICEATVIDVEPVGPSVIHRKRFTLEVPAVHVLEIHQQPTIGLGFIKPGDDNFSSTRKSKLAGSSSRRHTGGSGFARH